MNERPLWAPWRLEYITRTRSDECVFCVAARSQTDDTNLVLERGAVCFMMLNAFPYAPGHLMVVPYRHVDRLTDLTEDEASELMRLTRRAIAALDEAMAPGGFNVGVNLGVVAGAGIADHLHLHVVPRWQGDNNFMPVLADTHVMPQALEAAREALLRALGKPP
jgi:ATP adenylyltransferase